MNGDAFFFRLEHELTGENFACARQLVKTAHPLCKGCHPEHREEPPMAKDSEADHDWSEWFGTLVSSRSTPGQ